MVLILQVLISFFSICFCASVLSSHITDNKCEKNLVISILIYLIAGCLVLFCGFLGILSPWTITLLSTILFFIMYFLRNKKEIIHSYTFDLPDGYLGLLPLVVFVYYFINSALGTVWISLDDSTYHAAIPATWVVNKSFFTAPLTYQNGFPLNGSLFSTFFLVFFRTEYSASISEIILIIILFQSVILLLKSNDKSLSVTALMFAFAAICFSSDFQKYLNGFSDSDILPGVLLFASYSFLKQKNKKLDILAMWMVGFCIGVKLTNLFYSIPIIYVFFRKIKNSDYKILLYALMGSLVLATPWYAKNALAYSNPIYPFQKLFFKGLFTEAITSISSLKGVWSQLSNNQIKSILFGFLGWQKISFFIPLLMLINLIIYFKNSSIEKKWELFFFVLGAIVFFVAFWGAPFSARNESFGLNINSSRYLFPLLIPLFLISFKLPKDKRLEIISVLMLLLYIVYPRIQDKKLYLSILISSFYLFVTKKNKIKIRIFLLLFCFMLFVTVRSGSRTYKSKMDSIWYLNYLDRISPNKRVTIYNDFIFPGYYLHGEKLRHTPIRLNYYGEENIDFNNNDVLSNYIYPALKPNIDVDFCNKFVKNIKKANIDILILSKNKQNLFPVQNCENLNSDFLLEFEHANGVIYKKK